MKKLILGGFTVLATAMSLSASAATNTSSSSVNQVEPKLLDKFTASYLNVLYGPSLSGPRAGMEDQGRSYQPDADTGERGLGKENGRDTALYMKNYLTVGYKINDRYTIAPVAYFGIRPAYKADRIQWNDSYLKLTDNKFIQAGAFSTIADLRLAFPTSEASQKANMIAYVMSKQISSYEIAESRFSVGLYTYQLARFHAAAADVEGDYSLGAFNAKRRGGRRDVELYAGPNVNYQLTPTVGLNLMYEVAAYHTVGAGADFRNDGTDLEPNVSWDITPAVNLNPYLDIKTGGRIASDTTQIGATFNVKFF